ncbi:hypothetical protein FRC03_001233 [Tulasnella sp. 419]|nr:hypothetical protein FRC03_001233 [Tulasnella sp. 419]
MTNLSEQDYSSIGSQSRLSLLSITTLDVEIPAPPLQRDRERLPRLPQLQELSGAITNLELTLLNEAAPGPMQPSESYNRVVSEGEIRGPDAASKRPALTWEGDIEFQFLDSQSVCTPSLIVACDDWAVSASSEVLLFTLLSRLVLYNTARKTAREIDYGFHVESTSSVAHSLSPDGKTLLRWILNEENQTTTLLAIDVRRHQQIAKLQQGHKFQHSDLLSTRWIDGSTTYIPISAEGIVISWNILKAVSRNNLVRGTRMAEFFEPACHTIDASLKAIVGKGKAIVVLVGGFAGNSYLLEEVKRHLVGPNIEVTQTNDATCKSVCKRCHLLLLGPQC